MQNLNLKGIWIPIEILTDKKLYEDTYLQKVQYPPHKNVNTPIDENVKDNKYNNKNINKYNSTKQSCKKSKSDFEERNYTADSFTRLYANANILA